MKKKRSLILILSSSLILGGASSLSMVLTGCNNKEEEKKDEPGGEDEKKAAPKIVVTGGRNGYPGEKIKLNGQIFNSDKTELNWASSNSLVLTVDAEGYVSFLKAGKASVTATLKGDSTVKSSPVELTCYSAADGSKRLEITSLPERVSYKKGEKFSLAGIKVMGYLYTDGLKNPNSGVELAESELTFSLADGATLNTNGKITVNITAAGYEAASFVIEVNDNLIEKVAYVKKSPTKDYYLEDGSTAVDFSDLKIAYYTYTDGIRSSKATDLGADKYKLSMPTGTKITEEGNFEVIVTPIDTTIKGTVFTITVFTRDTSIQDLVRTLAGAKNYQYEIRNNVGTTRDTYGFHYVRTVTEDYYDQIEYQNTSDGTGNIEFSTNKIKDHTGYTTFRDGDNVGIMSYYEDALGSIKGGKVIVEGIQSSWRERKDAFATLFDKFSISLLPDKKMNGKFLIIPVEKVDGDDEDGTRTLAKYPLLDEFLSFCGWQGNLITIMTRFTVSLEGATGLRMRAIFGDYGYTEMILNSVGDASVKKVENAIRRGISPDMSVGDDVIAFRDALYQNNYTQYNYKSKATEGYYTQKYVYLPNKTGFNYIEVDGAIYPFEVVDGAVELGSAINTTYTTVPEYVNSLGIAGYGYAGLALKGVLGDATNKQRSHTLYKYAGFSYGNVVTYQSFDMTIVDTLSLFRSGEHLTDTDYRFWGMTTYVDATRDDPSKISAIELWAIDSNFSGLIYATRDVGTTAVAAIENYLASLD